MPTESRQPDLPDLPASAEARVSEYLADGSVREVAYVLDEEVVAVRLLHENGLVELHSPRRAGVRHGVEGWWDDLGQLRSAAPYLDGLEHGEAVQWGAGGNQLGTYTMRHGTGLDLWRAQRPDGTVYLAEVRFLVTGERHGYEWVVAEDQVSVHRESRYAAGTEHGIFREWDEDGRLTGGQPSFYLLGRAVPAEEYAAARLVDADLPAYADVEDLPAREFPTSVQPYLRPRGQR